MRKHWLGLASLGGAALALAVGCGDDDDTGPMIDASVVDASRPDGGSPDGATADAGGDVDGGGEDVDAGSDGGMALPVTIELERIGRYNSGIFAAGASEIVAFDPTTDRLFVVNAADATVDVLDLSDPTMPTRTTTIDVAAAAPTRTLGSANSVSVSNGTLGVAIEASPKTDNGVVAFYRTSDLMLLGTADVGALPDMLTFTPDGQRVLVANEGEPNPEYTIDPPGSISVIDVSGGFASPPVTSVTFTSFDAQETALREAGVRIFGPSASVSQDLEPEYIATNGTTAWVTLQENNAIAVVDLAATPPVVSAIRPLGLKDHSIPGNELDPSDRDNGANLASWPVRGMYMPDTIALFVSGGMPYLVTANEGDSRDYTAYSELARVSSAADVPLDPTAFPNAATLRAATALGRLRISTASGDTDGDDDFDELHAFGARSFSIWNGGTGALVFDSGDDFERITADEYGADFNNDNEENAGDTRSDDKGPEPEAVAVGTIGASTFAFIGLERMGGIMVYDVTDPTSATFVQYINDRDVEATLPDDLPEAGDYGPECIVFVSAANSPSGEPLVIVGNEISGTTSVYAVEVTPAD